jgi:hypothetical protein
MPISASITSCARYYNSLCVQGVLCLKTLRVNCSLYPHTIQLGCRPGNDHSISGTQRQEESSIN